MTVATDTSKAVPEYVLEAVTRAVKERCEPIIKQAIADCEQQIRETVHHASIAIAREINYRFDGNNFVISVQFKEPRK